MAIVQARTVMWQRVKLDDVCRDITVGHVGPMVDEYTDEGIPFLRSQNVQPFRLDLSSIKYISPEFHDRLRKSALKPGDVVVVRTGYPGTASVIPASLPVSNCADLVIIRPAADLDPYFLACLFNSTWGQGHVAGTLVGVAQQHFNIGAAREMTIGLPPLPTQRKIAAILSAYDDLIANNTRRIAILEQMAQALYREWFVHFRFPGHEHARMVDSPLGPIPEGWCLKTLGDVTVNFDSKRRPLSSLKRANMKGEYPYYGAAKVFDYIEDFIFDGEYLLVAEDGSVITSDRKPVLQYVVGKFWANNHTHVIQGRAPISTTYLYLMLSELDVSGYVTGAAQPKITQANLNRIPVLAPLESLLRRFQEMVGVSFAQAVALRRTIDNLRRTRDLLLRKLVSGEVDVEGLDIAGSEI